MNQFVSAKSVHKIQISYIEDCTAKKKKKKKKKKTKKKINRISDK